MQFLMPIIVLMIGFAGLAFVSRVPILNFVPSISAFYLFTEFLGESILLALTFLFLFLVFIVLTFFRL